MLEVIGVRRQRSWISLPFTDYCPPLGAADDIAAHLVETSRAAGIPRVEVRAALGAPAVARRSAAVLHRRQLEPDADAVFRTFHRSQVQRNIRRAERSGITVRRGESASDLVDVFYGLHLRTRRRHGVPVQPRRFFELLWRYVLEPGSGFLLLAYAGSRPVAGAVFLTANQTIIYKYGASEQDGWHLRPNHLIFWTMIQWACQQGLTVLDLGRTDLDNHGLRQFKAGWGTVEQPLVYSTIGEAAAGFESANMQKVIRPAIRHAPLWVCRALGELAYRYAA
jgi:CelD/BcsL family acetyltransferase involved in cellulose biosynthesis